MLISPFLLNFADLCPHFWGWGRGTSSCLFHSNKSREPWWSQKRRSKPKTEMPSTLLTKKLEVSRLNQNTPQLKFSFCHVEAKKGTFLWEKRILDFPVLYLSLTMSHSLIGMVHFNPNLPFFLLLADHSPSPGGHSYMQVDVNSFSRLVYNCKLRFL